MTSQGEATTQVYAVSGMTCQHCVNAVTEQVSALEGVTGVQVALDTGVLTISVNEPVEDAAVAAAVDEAGYTVAG